MVPVALWTQTYTHTYTRTHTHTHTYTHTNTHTQPHTRQSEFCFVLYTFANECFSVRKETRQECHEYIIFSPWSLNPLISPTWKNNLNNCEIFPNQKKMIAKIPNLITKLL